MILDCFSDDVLFKMELYFYITEFNIYGIIINFAFMNFCIKAQELLSQDLTVDETSCCMNIPHLPHLMYNFQFVLNLCLF